MKYAKHIKNVCTDNNFFEFKYIPGHRSAMAIKLN